MRKALTFVLAVIMCLSMLACGSEQNGDPVPPETSGTLSVEEPTTPVETEPKETDPPETEPQETKPVEVTISEQVVYEDEYYKLTVKGIDFSDDRSIDVKILAENNSDANISFVGNHFTVNGITMYCNFYIEVAAGKKANDAIAFDRDDLAAVGIENIATITAQDIFIYNDDTSKKVADIRFSIDTSIADGYQQPIDSNGQTVFVEDGLTVKYRGIVEDWSGDEALEFFVENKSDSNLTIYVDDVSVNGFMVYGNLVAYAYPNCVTYDTLYFSSSDMEENSIDAIEEVSFTLYAYDEDSSKKVWTSDEITVGRSAAFNDGNDVMSDLDVELEALKQILSGYENIDITHNNNIVTIEYWVPGVAQAVSQAASGNEDRLKLWNSLVENEKSQCLIASELFKSAGLTDLSVTWNILNDLDTEKVLLSIVDGEVVYNAIDE